MGCSGPPFSVLRTVHPSAGPWISRDQVSKPWHLGEFRSDLDSKAATHSTPSRLHAAGVLWNTVRSRYALEQLQL